MRKRNILGVGVLLVTLLLTGCPTSGYDKAGQLAKDFAASVLVAQQVEIQAHKAGYIDDQLHRAIQNELLQVADAGVKLDAAINQAHSTAGAAEQVRVIINLLADLSQTKLSGIKDQNTKLALQAAILTAQTTIDNIAAFGGK